MRERESDAFVRRAQQEGYRARAVYKLREIDARFRLLRTGMTVIDLGATPGGWSQYAHERIGPSGRLLALDLLEMKALPGVEFFRGGRKKIGAGGGNRWVPRRPSRFGSGAVKREGPY